jgi:non-lysosomal glucosylceramidase
MPRKCNCSGPCGPYYVDPDDQSAEESAVSRREFISLASIGTAGAMLVGGAAEARAAAAAADLAAWKQALLKPSAPRRYRSGVHTDARMHLGGIGTGNFEIGSDGQFTTWQLFNTLRDGYVPLCFGVRAGKTAKLLQTAGGPGGLPHVKSIEMTGEYPLATLKFVDPDVPVHVEMSAFTPFAPLDTEFSSMPAACFVFKVHNPTHQEQRVSIGAFMQNPVGYDAMGVPISFNSVGFNSVAARWTAEHPNFGGNYNEVAREDGATLLCMAAEPTAATRIGRPLQVFTNLPAGPFSLGYDERPEGLSIQGLQAVSRAAEESVANPPARLIWLEDAGMDLSADALRAAIREVRAGATLVFAGTTQPLLRHYAEVTGGKPLNKSALRRDIVFDDFENGYGNWTLEGDAFGTTPATGTLPSQQRVTGFVGQGLVNSFLNGDETTGKMISKPFTVERNYVRFLVGGGSSRATQIRLVVDGRTVRATSGRNDERLLPAYWDVREFVGKQAHIEIVDEQTGGWGHINVDQIEFGDLPGSVEILELLDDVLPARFSDIRSIPVTRRGGPAVEFVDSAPRSDARLDVFAGTGESRMARPLGRGNVLLVFDAVLEPQQVELVGARRTAYRRLAAIAGITVSGRPGSPARAPGFGTLALGTLAKSAHHYVAFSDWQDAWQRFAGQTFEQTSAGSSQQTPTGTTCNGALSAELVVPAGKTVEAPFFLAWRYSNKYSSAGENMGCHYAARWPDARTVATDVARSFAHLRARTERFHAAFYDSTLPYWMLDCITSQAATLRHIGVVFRIANGDSYGWEGSNGCCDPTCTHVWGYVANLARLFPDMERDMRRIDFKHQQGPDGGVNNRTVVPSPPRPTGERPFTDGHCSCVLKAYREALFTTDDRWLKEYWPNVKRAVEYLMTRDAASSGGNPDGVLEDDQWNTYDEALHGVTTFIGTYYLAALRAGEEWAKRVGDGDFADRCRAVFLAGQKNLVDRCWNGEYFRQDLPGYEKMGGEVGPGCMSDQLIGQWWAHQLGLGYLLPEEKVKTALRSVFKYNWMPDLTGWKHSPRAFAGAKDKGLIICTWPKGGRPNNVMLYSDEVWTGIEYQAAAHMIYEGMIDEGFAIVKGARDRYDGIARPPIPRNPWNEIECGGHYARAGSSWTLLLALSGWQYDGVTGDLAFRPVHTPGAFKSFFSAPEGWGSASQSLRGARQRSELRVVEGRLAVSTLRLDAPAHTKSARVTVAGKAVPATLTRYGDGVTLHFASPLILAEGQTLSVSLS